MAAKRKPRKYSKTISDGKAMVARSMVDAGMSHVKVAEAVGVNRRWVDQYIHHFEGDGALTEWFRGHRADLFANQQMHDMALINRIRTVKFGEGALTDEEILAMSYKDADAIMNKAMVRIGISHDKEQVERNRGVEDVSKFLDVVAKIKQIEKMQEEGG